MAFEIEFGSRGAANEVRGEFEEHIAGEPDRRTKTVAIEEGAPEQVMEQATGKAAVTREERSTGLPGVELTETEKKRIDFTKVSAVEARQAKAKAVEKGVGDFVSFFDQEATVGEHEEIFEQAARESSGGRDARRSVQERHAEAHKASESEMLKHARKGVKHGSKKAERELRRRGVSEEEIRRLKRQPAGRLDRRTKVLFPDVGEISPQEWAEAKRSHEHRRVEAQRSDENKRAQRVVADVDEWKEAPGKRDFPGVDTQRSVSSWLDDEQAEEFTELTDELWKWQG